MKTSALIRIIIYIVVAVICISVLVIGLVSGTFKGIKGINLGGINYSMGSDEGYIAASRADIKEKVNRINIDWISGKVTVEEYDGDTVMFWEDNNSSDPDLQMRYTFSNGVLRIRYAKSTSFNIGAFTNVIKELTVQIPRGYVLDDMKIDAVSSPVRITGTAVSTLGIDTTSGAVTVSHIVSDSVNINTVSGKIELRDAEVKDVDFDSVSGSQNFTGVCEKIHSNSVSGEVNIICTRMLKDAFIDTVSGAIAIYLPENAGFKVRWDSVSGRFNCDFPITYQSNSATYGDGSASIRINTVSGRMSISSI